MRQSDPNARRTRTQHRGVYYRTGRDGRRRYEITFTDTDGRQRWTTVDGKLEDAIAARDAVKDRLRRGARVAPRKVTFEEAANAWLDRQTNVRPRTRESYDWALRVHLRPRFRRYQVAAINEDEIAAFIADLQKRGLSGWTIRAALKPLNGVLNAAARAGQIAQNPMHRLERGERPSVPRKRVAVLNGPHIGKVLAAADEDRDRPLLATAVFSGLRIAELLGLTWGDVDLPSGYLHVRYQLERRKGGERQPIKTDAGVRDVKIMPALVKELRAYRLRAVHSHDDDYVFPTAVGKGLDQTVARNALTRALKGAELSVDKFTFHGLRHTFASLLIAQGEDVVYVAGQLGHSDPNVTLRVYGHLFDQRRHAEAASAAMEAEYGKLLESAGGNGPQSTGGLTAV